MEVPGVWCAGRLGCGGFEALLECSFMKAQSHIHSI